MPTIKEHSNNMDCIMIHQTLQARTSKKRGETVNYAARVVEERMNEKAQRTE